MPRPLARQQALVLLAEHPARIAGAVAGVPAARLTRVAMLGEWTAVDVLAHLRCCADAGGGMIERLLGAPGGRIPGIDQRTAMETSPYRRLGFAASLRRYHEQRDALVQRLGRLDDRDWTVSARVFGTGATRERSVMDYVTWLARHEEVHIPQFDRLGRRLRRAHA